MNCADCRFWNPYMRPSPQMYAGCHRHSPAIGTRSDGSSISLWPQTHRNDFCGDFEEYIEPKAQITAEEIDQLAGEQKP